MQKNRGRKRKTDLTLTGLLMEGFGADVSVLFFAHHTHPAMRCAPVCCVAGNGLRL